MKKYLIIFGIGALSIFVIYSLANDALFLLYIPFSLAVGYCLCLVVSYPLALILRNVFTPLVQEEGEGKIFNFWVYGLAFLMLLLVASKGNL